LYRGKAAKKVSDGGLRHSTLARRKGGNLVNKEVAGQNDLKERMTRRGYRLVALWAIGILLIYAVGGYLGVRTLQKNKGETEKFREAAIEAATAAPGVSAPDIRVTPGPKPTDVHVGIYVNRVGEISLREGRWAADFDIWFRWTGDKVRPGENFQIVNGDIELREKKAAYVRGREHYERYRVKARLPKFFDPSRFPFNDEALVIQVEDGGPEAEKLRYVAEERESGVNRLGVLRILKITKSLATVKLNRYGTRRGDPGIPYDKPEVHSRFTFAMLVAPSGGPIYLRNFQALFAAVAIAFIAFFIKPTHVDPRFGLGVGAVFVAVGNNIYAQTLIPYSDQLTLTTMINGIGFATFFLTLVQSAISLYVFDTMGRERLSRYFDKVSFAVFLIGYAVTNLILPLAARP
jgi:hypothetical protein